MCLADTATHLPCLLRHSKIVDGCLGGYGGAMYVQETIFFFNTEVNN